MTSSVHYKFRATIDYKTLQFDGLSILGSDLKREICTKEGIRAEAFDLKLQNAQTKRNYTNEDLIPRNSSVIVQRVPKENAEKLPKIQSGSGGIVAKQVSGPSAVVEPTHMDRAEFEKLSEEAQIQHIKDVSTAKYAPANYQKRAAGIYSGKPPATYICHRCNEPGHWGNNCPMLKTKLTTGIPSQELMETTKDDPHAMLHPSGKYVIPIKHWEARNKKVVTSDGNVLGERKPPAELTCPLCGQILRDAMLTVCCGDSFCADCVTEKLMESETRACPGVNCSAEGVSVDSLVPNLKVRQAVNTWLNQVPEGVSTNVPPPPQQQKVRIGLRAQPRTEHSSTTNQSRVQVQPGTQAQVQLGISGATVLQQVQIPTGVVVQQQQPQPLVQPPQVVHLQTTVQQQYTQVVPTAVIRPAVQPQVATPVIRPQPEVLLPPGVSVTSLTSLPAIPASAAVALPLDSLRTVASSQFPQPPPPGVFHQQQLLPPGVAPEGITVPGKRDPLDAFIDKLRHEKRSGGSRRRHRSRSVSSDSSSSSSSLESDSDRHRRERRHRHHRDSGYRDRGSSRRYVPSSSSTSRGSRLHETRSRPISMTIPTFGDLLPPGVDAPRPASLLDVNFAPPPGLRLPSYYQGSSSSRKDRDREHERKRSHRSDRRDDGERSEKRRKEERRKERRPREEDDEDEQRRKEEEAIDASLKEVQQLARQSSGDHSEADTGIDDKEAQRAKERAEDEGGSGADNEDEGVVKVLEEAEPEKQEEGEEDGGKKHKHKKEKKEKHHKKHKKHKREGETEEEREVRRRKKKERKEKRHKEGRHSKERDSRKNSRDEGKEKEKVSEEKEPSKEKKDVPKTEVAKSSSRRRPSEDLKEQKKEREKEKEASKEEDRSARRKKEGRGYELERELIRRRDERREKEKREGEAKAPGTETLKEEKEDKRPVYVTLDGGSKTSSSSKERPTVDEVFAVGPRDTKETSSSSKIRVLIKK